MFCTSYSACLEAWTQADARFQKSQRPDTQISVFYHLNREKPSGNSLDIEISSPMNSENIQVSNWGKFSGISCYDSTRNKLTITEKVLAVQILLLQIKIPHTRIVKAKLTFCSQLSYLRAHGEQ